MIEHVNLYKRKIVEKRTIFITLTYPGAYPATREAKRHLDNFLKRLHRKYPEAGGVWRLEWQERGAPHFHLLVFGVRFIPWQWVAQAWYEVCGEISPEHLAAGSETRQARSRKQAFYYLSKYLAKTTQEKPVGQTMTPEQLAACVEPGVVVPGVTDAEPTIVSSAVEEAEGPGRLWGHWGKWQQYQSEIKEVLIEVGDISRVARTLDKLRQADFRAKDGTRKRKRVGRKKFVDRHARWYVNGSELWRVLGRLAAVHVAPLAAKKAAPVSRSSRRLSSDLTRDRRAFVWAFKQFAGLAWGVLL